MDPGTLENEIIVRISSSSPTATFQNPTQLEDVLRQLAEKTSSYTESTLIFEVISNPRNNLAGKENQPESSNFWNPFAFSWSSRRGYQFLPQTQSSQPAETRHRRQSLAVWTLTLLILSALFLFIVAIIYIKRDPTYIRYDTSGSTGPRHQLRIYWQNASSWAQKHPQDTDEWRVRIDDQTIIPRALYDEDEDRYQQWYRARYPEAAAVVDNLNYVRPSWLGSLDMMVPWDDQFHFAHCVLALRRYWKAKESGRHVCGRDIDHAHVYHCLKSLEERVFVEGPREKMDPPQFLYWQTRVCF